LDSGVGEREEVSTIFKVNIIPVPSNQIYPTPKILGESLNSKMKLLKARLPLLDDTY
jgi:hypothetical protein